MADLRTAIHRYLKGSPPNPAIDSLSHRAQAAASSRVRSVFWKVSVESVTPTCPTVALLVRLTCNRGGQVLYSREGAPNSVLHDRFSPRSGALACFTPQVSARLPMNPLRLARDLVSSSVRDEVVHCTPEVYESGGRRPTAHGLNANSGRPVAGCSSTSQRTP